MTRQSDHFAAEADGLAVADDLTVNGIRKLIQFRHGTGSVFTCRRH
jgi:hypothetical protein